MPAPSPSRPIAVVGATGFTGRLVVAELTRRALPVRVIGRDRARLENIAAAVGGTEVRTVAWERGALASALEGCGAVVSCAGPFLEVGWPVVEAAIDARVPYCDSTGEQPFIHAVYIGLGARAEGAGIVLAPAFGFDYVPGDLGAAIVAEGMGRLERIDVVYAVERADTSVGTRRSTIGLLGHPARQWVGGRLVVERIGSRRRTVDTPWGRRQGGSIPGGEPLMLPRHLDVDTVVGYLSFPGPMNPANRGTALLGLVARTPLLRTGLDRLAARGPAGPDAPARSARACCVVEATAGDGRRRTVRVEGRDVYGFTAVSLAEVARRMDAGEVDAVGACSPAETVPARPFLEATGMTVVEVEPPG